MSCHTSYSNCEVCGFETLELCGTNHEQGCQFEERWCMSLFCGEYYRKEENFRNPELSFEEYGKNDKEGVCGIREMANRRYGKK